MVALKNCYFFYFIHCHFTGGDNLVLFDLYQPIIVKNKFLNLLLNVKHSKIKGVQSLCYYVDTLNHMLPISATKNLNEWKSLLYEVYLFPAIWIFFACDAIRLI